MKRSRWQNLLEIVVTGILKQIYNPFNDPLRPQRQQLLEAPHAFGKPGGKDNSGNRGIIFHFKAPGNGAPLIAALDW